MSKNRSYFTAAQLAVVFVAIFDIRGVTAWTPPATSCHATTCSRLFAAPRASHGGDSSASNSDVVRQTKQTPSQQSSVTSRADFLQSTTRAAALALMTTLLVFDPMPTMAFEGGIGGLGKTKPETGVEFFGSYLDAAEKPISQGKNGIVSAELAIVGQPVLVSFYAPAAWPLSGTAAGLEARDLAQPEATYVHVVNTNDNINVAKLAIVESTNDATGVTTPGLSRSTVKEIMLDSVLAQQGKFGAYGSPTDIKVKKWKAATSSTSKTIGSVTAQDLGTYQVSFVTLTPGLRESERVLLVSMRRVSSAGGAAALVMLVTGTTRLRFASQESLLDKVASSWEVVPAPPSSRTDARAAALAAARDEFL